MSTNWKKMGVYLKVGRPSKHTLGVVDFVMQKKQEAIHEMNTRIDSDLLQGEIVYRIQLPDGKFHRKGHIYAKKHHAQRAITDGFAYQGVIKRYHLVPIIEVPCEH